MVGNDANRLTDVEYWVLLSLDDAAPLPELLRSIFQGAERSSRIPWRQSEEREIRPELTVDQVSAALPGLVGAGLVEVRPVRLGEVDNSDEGRRALAKDEVLAVVDDPSSWQLPAGIQAEYEYWAEITEAGEEAYRRSRDQRERSTS